MCTSNLSHVRANILTTRQSISLPLVSYRWPQATFCRPLISINVLPTGSQTCTILTATYLIVQLDLSQLSCATPISFKSAGTNQHRHKSSRLLENQATVEIEFWCFLDSHDGTKSVFWMADHLHVSVMIIGRQWLVTICYCPQKSGIFTCY